MVESGHTQRNFCNATLIWILFENSTDLRRNRKCSLKNLGKCWKTNCTNKPRMQKRGDKERSPVKEKVHILRCVINIRCLVSSIYSHCWSWPLCPNFIGSVNWTNHDTEARRKREAKAQAAKRQTNNYEGQSESKEIKAREPRVHMCTNLVPRPSPPLTACILNWSRGKPGNEITSIPHAYVY